MDRDIHDIYDVILKIIVLIYGSEFLKYIGIDEEIKEFLNVEFTTLKGTKVYLDFLCRLKSGSLLHLEFQYPFVKPKDYPRFFNYNILAESTYQTLTETGVFNYSPGIGKIMPWDIGESKCFKPYHFFLGDVDFENYIENINIKVKSNKQLTAFEEITLMLISLNTEFDDKCKILKWVSRILEYENLFDQTKYQFVQAIVELEIDNLLSKDEQIEFKEDIKMTPKAMEVVTQAINEVNRKVLAESKAEGKAEGLVEGEAEGMVKGRSEAMEDVARSLRDQIDLDVLSSVTGLTVDEILNL